MVANNSESGGSPIRRFFIILATACSISGVGIEMLLAGWHPKIGIVLIVAGYFCLLFELLTCRPLVTKVPEGMLRLMLGVMVSAFALLIAGPDMEATLHSHFFQPQPLSANVQPTLYLDCTAVPLPVSYGPHNDLYVVDASYPRGLTRFTAGNNSGMFPRPNFIGWGYHCKFLDYETDAMLNITAIMTLIYKSVIPGPDSSNPLNAATEGPIVSTSECHLEIPRIDGKNEFAFYLSNGQDSAHFIEIIPPRTAVLETTRDKATVTVDVRLINDIGSRAMTLMPMTPRKNGA
jgi:hypothetical protein